MEVIIKADYDEVCAEGARWILEEWKKKDDLVLGLATGRTSLGVYKRLTEFYNAKEMDFWRVRTFNLDEYLGLAEDHPRSYAFFMDENFFKHVNVRRENIHRLSGRPGDIDRHCTAYEEAIRKVGGIDIQLLGVGRNGHIGFNEPGSSLASRTRVKTLTETTIADNVRFFEKGESVPRFVLTVGIGTIMEARSILLLAYGANKAEAIRHTVEGPLTASVPASALQLHPRVRIIVDEEAARLLKLKDYYRYVHQNKHRIVDYLEK